MTSEAPTDFARSAANFVALSPLSFLARAKDVFGHRLATIYGARRATWAEFHDRAARLGGGLRALGLAEGEVVSAMLANTPEMVEAHFGVAMAGGVLNTINTRLDPETVGYILAHAEAKILLTDTQFAPVIKAALDTLPSGAARPVIVDVVDPAAGPDGERLGALDYEALQHKGASDQTWGLPDDEWSSIALNYTSGTSGRPKGVLYHHRGAYLIALGTIAGWDLPAQPRYLYTVPLFHCNGWGHAWTMAGCGGTIVCNRTISAKAIFDAVVENEVTHFGAAPVILGMLANAPEAERRALTRPVKVMTAGAPPPAAVLERVEALGFDVMHVYGLTETYGHVTESLWRDEWDALGAAERAALKARQGVPFPMVEAVDVVDIDSRAPTPADGVTAGEIIVRGNTVMKGYFKDAEATAKAFEGGAFRSGDVAVRHADGHIEVKDRLKDVIISGGENISSVEVESVLYRHPAVAVAAVVAKPAQKWGETTCAFVELKPGVAEPSADEVIAFCRANMAHFKCPRHVVFGALPKTSTGKVQKFVLRELAKEI